MEFVLSSAQRTIISVMIPAIRMTMAVIVVSHAPSVMLPLAALLRAAMEYARSNVLIVIISAGTLAILSLMQIIVVTHV